MSGAGELVGDGADGAGHGGGFVVDLVEEEPQGLGDGGGAGLVEGDGDRGCGAGDGSGEAADDRLAGDGAGFVVVAQVGVEVAGPPVAGGAGGWGWMWLAGQCSAWCARSRRTICRVRRLARSKARWASGSISLAGSRAGILSRAVFALVSWCSAVVIFFWAAGIRRVFLSVAGMAGSRSSAARPARAR